MVERVEKQKKGSSKKQKIALAFVIVAIFATSWWGFNAARASPIPCKIHAAVDEHLNVAPHMKTRIAVPAQIS